MIYAGTFHRTMDAKKRVTVPSDWLGSDGEVLYMLPQRSGRYINVMPADEFARQEDEVRAKVSPKAWRTIMREIFSAARKIEPDKQGRIVIPEEFCKAAGLSADVTFLGVKNSFEIWDAARRSNAAQEKEDALPAEAQEALEDMGL